MKRIGRKQFRAGLAAGLVGIGPRRTAREDGARDRRLREPAGGRAPRLAAPHAGLHAAHYSYPDHAGAGTPGQPDEPTPLASYSYDGSKALTALAGPPGQPEGAGRVTCYTFDAGDTLVGITSPGKKRGRKGDATRIGGRSRRGSFQKRVPPGGSALRGRPRGRRLAWSPSRRAVSSCQAGGP